MRDLLARIELGERCGVVHREASGRGRAVGGGSGSASTVSTENASASACSIARMLPASRRSADAWLEQPQAVLRVAHGHRVDRRLQRDLGEGLLLAHGGEHARRRPRRPPGRASVRRASPASDGDRPRRLDAPSPRATTTRPPRSRTAGTARTGAAARRARRGARRSPSRRPRARWRRRRAASRARGSRR